MRAACPSHRASSGTCEARRITEKTSGSATGHPVPRGFRQTTGEGDYVKARTRPPRVRNLAPSASRNLGGQEARTAAAMARATFDHRVARRREDGPRIPGHAEQARTCRSASEVPKSGSGLGRRDRRSGRAPPGFPMMPGLRAGPSRWGHAGAAAGSDNGRSVNQPRPENHRVSGAIRGEQGSGTTSRRRRGSRPRRHRGPDNLPELGIHALP